MKKFIENHFVTIVLVITVLSFFKSCGDGRELTAIKKEIKEIKENTYTKEQLDIRIRIEGLNSETRMIQATDRKMFDLNRQTEIEREVKELKKSLNN